MFVNRFFPSLAVSFQTLIMMEGVASSDHMHESRQPRSEEYFCSFFPQNESCSLPIKWKDSVKKLQSPRFNVTKTSHVVGTNCPTLGCYWSSSSYFYSGEFILIASDSITRQVTHFEECPSPASTRLFFQHTNLCCVSLF